MKKQSVFLVFVLALTSCTSSAQSTPVPSSDPTEVATQAPVSEAWQTYTNAEAGFSIQYPATWQQQDLPDENDGQLHRVALQGPEGGIELTWGVGVGGACPEGYQQLAVAQGTVPACHSQKEDGTELWSLAPPPIGDISFGGLVHTNDTTPESRDLVLQVLSTLSFP